MAIGNKNAFYYIKLTLKLKTDASTTKDIYISNRPVLEDTNTGRYIPALQKIDGFGIRAGGWIPEPNNGRIDIDDSEHSYGYQRKISDLFERYTCINQDCELYYAAVDADDNNISADAALVWKDKVNTIRLRNGKLSLTLRSDAINNKSISRMVSTDVDSAAPTKSLGKFVPMVIGEGVQVRPVETDNDPTTSVGYSYGSTLGVQYYNKGITNYYVKDPLDNNRYIEVSSAASVSTALYQRALDGNEDGGTAGATWTAYKFTASTAYLITHATWYTFKTGGGSFDSENTTSCSIWSKREDTDLPDQMLCIASLPHTSAVNISGDSYSNTAGFDKAVPLEKDKDYYIAFGFNEKSGASTSMLPTRDQTSQTVSVYGLAEGTDSTGWSKTTATATYRAAYYKIFGTTFTDNSLPGSQRVNELGLGVSEVLLTSDGSVTAIPTLSDIDILLKVDGLQDDGSGTITGSANAIINEPHELFKLLTSSYNGSTWSVGNFDTSKYSGTHGQFNDSTEPYYRQLSGHATGEITLEQLARVICEDSQCKLVKFSASSNDIGLYAIGTNIASSALITDDDIIELQYETRDLKSVVNDARISYNPSLTNFQPIDAFQQRRERGYESFKHLGYNDSGTGQHISAVSEDLFGIRELQDTRNNWINNEAQIENIARLILSKSDLPSEDVRLTLPYQKYNTLEPYDVVSIASPELPTFYGAFQDPDKYNFTTGGTQNQEVTTTNPGRNLRAKEYRAQIYEIRYNFKEQPTMEIRCKLLIHPNDPT